VEVPTIVQVLPDHVIDQIAAGEVVERPASVVKELVENALDAGARTVTIEIEAGGRKLVRVVDDGCGMRPADARLALARHATSKLRSVDDLAALGTMGFRGEALPSIASVSRMTLTTRTRDDEAALRIVLNAGRVESENLLGAPVGTCVEVADLLFNVPARLKFLRGEVTEASHITETVLRLAMAHPEVAFRLRHGGRIAFECAASELAVRVRGLLGGRLAERMHLVEHEENGVRVRAFLAAPDLAQTTSRGVQLFAGRRWIRDRALLQAVTMGYGELVPRGRYPVAVAMVDVPGGEIDVNVHPQKLEVRFSDGTAVTAAVRHAVRKGCAASPWLQDDGRFAAAPVRMHAVASMEPPPPRRADDLAGRYAENTVRSLFPVGGLSRPPSHQGSLGLAAAEPGPGEGAWERVRARVAGRAASVPSPNVPVDRDSSVPVAARDADTQPLIEVPRHEARVSSGVVESAGFFASLRFLGQLDRTYLVCEGDGELVLIDQHAAHERVAFQRLRERADTDAVATQRLLFPTTIELPPGEAAVVADGGPLLGAVGFDVEPFGPSAVAIKAVPAGLRHDPSQVLRELLGDLADRGGSRAVDERLDRVLATIACHSVVRAGDVLGADEARALLGQMDGVDFRAHCPHGRPVLLRIGVPEIARRFGRT
jgi:DNA mismatch repair protein MutL